MIGTIIIPSTNEEAEVWHEEAHCQSHTRTDVAGIQTQAVWFQKPGS